MNRNDIRRITKETITSSINNYAKNSAKKKRKFQILDLIIPRQKLIRSIVGGMEGSMGTTFWEPLGKALAKGNGFTIIDEDLECPSNMPSSLSNMLQSIMEARKSDNGLYDAQISHDALKRVCQSFKSTPIDSFKKPKSGSGVDIWLVKNGINYFFDTKTVQPNLSQLTSCLEQLLGWYAYYYSKFPDGSAVSRIVFPYNPTPEKSFWNGVTGGGKPLEPNSEAWVQDEFWDFCSGVDGTFAVIKKSFIELADDGTLEDVFNNLFK